MNVLDISRQYTRWKVSCCNFRISAVFVRRGDAEEMAEELWDWEGDMDRGEDVAARAGASKKAAKRKKAAPKPPLGGAFRFSM